MRMTQDLLTVETAATELQLHPKTVLRFIREGRLKATRVGRGWRIPRAEINAFAGLGDPEPRTGTLARATAIVEIPDLTIEEAERIVSGLNAALASPRPRPIQLETAYDRVARALKLVIIAAPGDAGTLLSLLGNAIES